MVLVFALALIIPFGLVGMGQLSGNNEQTVPGAARDTRGPADPASQPKPTNTTAPNPAKFAGMNQPTEAGAKASADHLFAVYAYMIATGDTSQWEQLSAPECQECLAFSSQSAALHQQGGWIVGGEITLSDQKIQLGKVSDNLGGAQNSQAGSDGGQSSAAPDAEKAKQATTSDPAVAKQPSALINATFHEANATLVDNPRLEPQERKASQGTFSLTMRHDGTHWLVTGMTVK